MTSNKLSKYPAGAFSPRGQVEDNPAHASSNFPYLMGVELELERVKNPAPHAPAGWEQHDDQSLRNGVEYVTAGPMSGLALKRAIATFYAAGITWANSPRTSTHIHVNASDMTVDQVRTMFTLSYILEDALFQIIGAGRKFSGYCMPLFEMPPHRIKSILCSESTGNFNAAMGGPNVDKYYGFNINSIRKHGTVEFRYFYGGPSKEELNSWLAYCTSIKRAAKNISLADLFALPTPEALGDFITTFFGDWSDRIIGVVGIQSLYDNLQSLSVLFPDPDRLVRDDALVFVTSDLLKAVSRCYFSESPERANAFVAKASKLQVMSRDTWYALHREIRGMSAKSQGSEYRRMVDAARQQIAEGARARPLQYDEIPVPPPQDMQAVMDHYIALRQGLRDEREAQGQAVAAPPPRGVVRPRNPQF